MSRRSFRAQDGACRTRARIYRRSDSAASMYPVMTSSSSAASLPMQQGFRSAPGSWLSGIAGTGTAGTSGWVGTAGMAGAAGRPAASERTEAACWTEAAWEAMPG